MDGTIDKSGASALLSKTDVAALRRDPGEGGRSKTAARVARLFTSGMLTDAEHAVALEVIEALSLDTAERVRGALCEHVKNCPTLPPGLARTIASDIDSVSLPFLEVSQALSDEALVEIIKNGSPDKQITIAKRSVVTRTVTEALVDTKRPDVVNTLLDNPGARFSEPALHKVAEQSANDEGMQVRLARRVVLPLAVTERLISYATARVRDYIVEQHEFPRELADEIALHGRERALTESLSSEFRTDQVQDLVTRMIARGELTPTLILRSLCIGDLHFFMAAYKVLTGRPEDEIRVAVFEDDDDFRRMYRNCGLPDVFFPAFLAAIRILRADEKTGGDNSTFTRRVIKAMMNEYPDVCPRDLEHMLTQLSRRLKKAEAGGVS